jgi:hypothetical protein
MTSRDSLLHVMPTLVPLLSFAHRPSLLQTDIVLLLVPITIVNVGYELNH